MVPFHNVHIFPYIRKLQSRVLCSYGIAESPQTEGFSSALFHRFETKRDIIPEAGECERTIILVLVSIISFLKYILIPLCLTDHFKYSRISVLELGFSDLIILLSVTSKNGFEVKLGCSIKELQLTADGFNQIIRMNPMQKYLSKIRGRIY